MLSTNATIGLSVIILIIILGGLLGNLLILLALKRLPVREKPGLLLLGNLALSDLLLASVVQPYQLATLIKPSLIKNGGTLCQAGGVVSYPVFIVSLGTLVGMCVDRFYAIGNPLLYRVRITFNVVVGMILYPWFHAFAFGIATGVVINVKYDPQTNDCGLGWKERHVAFTLFVLLTHVVVPFFTILISNVLLIGRLKSHNKKLRRLGGNSQVDDTSNGSLNRQQRGRQGIEKKVTIMVNWILTTFLCCWTPYLLTRALNMANIKLPSSVQTGSVWMLHANSMINPIVYTHFRNDLKTTIWGMLGLGRGRNQVAPLGLPSNTDTQTRNKRSTNSNVQRHNTNTTSC